MVTIKEYIGPHSKSKDLTLVRKKNAAQLLEAVNALMVFAIADGVDFPVNPKTQSQVSGKTFGGFRPQNCPIGAPNSNHKEGRGIDLYDPDNEIDAWCLDNQTKLVACGIWIEHPDATQSWSHWQSVAPRSGNRVYRP